MTLQLWRAQAGNMVLCHPLLATVCVRPFRLERIAVNDKSASEGAVCKQTHPGSGPQAHAARSLPPATLQQSGMEEGSKRHHTTLLWSAKKGCLLDALSQSPSGQGQWGRAVRMYPLPQAMGECDCECFAPLQPPEYPRWMWLL